MVTSIQSIVLVTPVWNDSARLEVFGHELAQTFAAAAMPIRWIIADDGSKASERMRYSKLLRRFQAIYPNIELMHFSPRSCKGGAVYGAWNQCPNSDYLAFVDGDGAVCPDAVIRLLRRVVEAGGSSGVIGVRAHGGRLAVRRTLLRALSYYLFRFLVRKIVKLDSSDTQCGAKAFPARQYREISDRLFEQGFVFDVELLLAFQQAGVDIQEMDIPWQEIAGSRVNLMRDSRQMLAGLFRIRRRSKSGVYDHV
ncbi:glycosyltransferase [Coraliomargarita algicola]|uniref:Glycosyltransferase n=1 Tax=Coraliomargarita algicola TaxID=3092156 RepID=A0ABZ0RN73_9BACT|nr:glycosyltransferase [Coraliomargarita sp. J2-16]WPJ96215.1 glycosyltransferase [Coraliomargarita sp. J2-16]